MQVFPSISHMNVWELTLPQWWSIAQSVDAWRKEQKNRARKSRASRPSRSRRP